MPSSSTVVATAILVFVAIAAGAVYVLGVPKDVKRGLGEKALETMGDNKASHFVQDAINQLPEDNRLQSNDLKRENDRPIASELKSEGSSQPASDLKSNAREVTGSLEQNLAGDGIWEASDKQSKVSNSGASRVTGR